MPARLTHIVDEETHEDGARELSLLLRLLPGDRVNQRVVVIGQAPAALTVPPEVEVGRVGRRLAWPVAPGPNLHGLLEKLRPDVVYAWSVTAAAVATSAWRDEGRIVAVVSDPAEAELFSRWWCGEGGQDCVINLICSAGTVQRRLVEAGVPIEATAVIRPGVDLAAIRRAKGTIRREDLGLPPRGRVLLTASTPSRAGGQYYAIWAAAILHMIWPDMRLVLPGVSREQERLRRFVESLYCPEVYCLTGNRYTPAELLAVSDMLIVPAVGDVATGWLAWAMSASVPIVASAVPAVTELISDRRNGFLCKAGEPHTLATLIRAAAEAGDTVRQCVEMARAEAYELFGAQRCVDEHLRVIENALAGNHPQGETRAAS